MENLETCPTCACFCWLVTRVCIGSFSEIPADRTEVIRVNDINNANDDVGDLIGEACADALCLCIKSAIEKAKNENVANFLPYLPAKWRALISNKHFKKWYSNRVAFHWFEGASISEIRKAGLIVESNKDEGYTNGFSHAAEKERQRLATNASNYAAGSRAKFLKFFFTKDKAVSYGCIDSSCSPNTKDNTRFPPIRTTVI